MRNINKEDRAEKLEGVFEKQNQDTFVFSLYIAGATPRSIRAIENIKKLCEEYLKWHYELTVIDVLQQPDLLKKEQITATPTLLRKLPLPIRRYIGDLSDTEKILVGLERKK